MARRKSRNISCFLLAALVITLASCGIASQQTPSGRFAGKATNAASGPTVESVTLSPTQLTGGTSTEITIHLTQAAPNGGITVQLVNSDDGVVSNPAAVTIPAGETSTTAKATTTSVTAKTTVAISAIYDDAVASAALTINPATGGSFTLTLQPSSLTKSPGQSASAEVTTKIASGYDHALTLKASNLPAGVSLTFSPSAIPAPGAGSSKAAITLPSGLKPGSYSIHVTATGGSTSESATLTLKVSANPGATFHGCWYKQNGNRYQGVDFSLADPGTYPFNANLYYGTTCNPNQQADEFGFGTDLNFGSFDYTFWFTAFANQTDMSAIWQVGTDQSQCVNYENAPSC
jgi:hypothetical protein